MPRPLPPPETCANCGAALPRNAKACPDCGADERSGWREQSVYDSLDLPDEAWHDDASPAKSSPRPSINGVAWYWWIVGALLLLALVGGMVIGR